MSKRQKPLPQTSKAGLQTQLQGGGGGGGWTRPAALSRHHPQLDFSNLIPSTAPIETTGPIVDTDLIPKKSHKLDYKHSCYFLPTGDLKTIHPP